MSWQAVNSVIRLQETQTKKDGEREIIKINSEGLS